MQAQVRHCAARPSSRASLARSTDFLVVGVHHERERRPVCAGGRLDHMRHVALAGRLVEVLELLPGELARAG